MNRIVSCLVAILLVPMFASCAARSKPRTEPVLHEGMSLAELASVNQAKMARLTLGMSKADLLSLMGVHTAETHDGVVNNPWTVEAFQGEGSARYEVLYFVTRPNPPFRPVSKALATPVVLKDGSVIGWGDEALERVGRGK